MVRIVRSIYDIASTTQLPSDASLDGVCSAELANEFIFKSRGKKLALKEHKTFALCDR